MDKQKETKRVMWSYYQANVDEKLKNNFIGFWENYNMGIICVVLSLTPTNIYNTRPTLDTYLW